jgi:hypothetical protein
MMMATTADRAHKLPETQPAALATKAGFTGSAPVRSLDATARQLNARPRSVAQRALSGAAGAGNAGPALTAMLDTLAATAESANEMAAKAGTEAPSAQLAERVKRLRAIAESEDDAAKAQALSGLRSELGRLQAPPSHGEVAHGEPAQHAPVQRVGVAILLGAGLLAVGIGALAKKAYNYIRDRRENAALTHYYTVDTGPLTATPIPADLLAGIAALAAPAARAQRLFHNINAFRFRYTGQFVAARPAFATHQGDCKTLTAMYQEVANSLPAAQNIPFAVGSHIGRMLVARRPIHGRAAQGNTHGETDWYFQDHWWAIGNGTPYDLLFMTTPVAPADYTNGSQVHDGVTYYTFASGRCLIEPAARFGAEITGQGRVFANAADATQFIDDN